jgi:hypothetical protein
MGLGVLAMAWIGWEAWLANRTAPASQPELASPSTRQGSAAAPAATARPSGALPTVWNVEVRNREFTGRDALLVQLREFLHAGGAAVVQALHGMGGVGKTQLAMEYAHRFASDYELVWWIAAEEPVLIRDQLADLGIELGLVRDDVDTATAVRAIKAHLRSHADWLLIFDNAENPADLRAWLPGGPGHVIVTSRRSGWDYLAVSIEVDVMSRAESTALLRDHHPGPLTGKQPPQLDRV